MRLLGAAILALAAAGAFAQQAHELDVLWVGTYKIGETKAMEDPTAPTGFRYAAVGIEPLESTRRVPAVIGSRFGVAYALTGEVEGAAVTVQAYWRFPPSGLTNPETRTTVFEWRTPQLQCRVEQKPFCLIGYPLQHAWELVPGRWTLELWVEGARAFETSFDLYVP